MWGRALALGFGLCLLLVAVLHVIHGDYVMAPPSFVVAVVLVYLAISGGKKAGDIPPSEGSGAP